MPNYEAEMQKVAKEMQNTEEALLATGFSPEQWALIKNYILSALNLNEHASQHTN
jgi:hypothetical protein